MTQDAPSYEWTGIRRHAPSVVPAEGLPTLHVCGSVVKPFDDRVGQSTRRILTNRAADGVTFPVA